MARTRRVQKAIDPYTDGSGGWAAPDMSSDMLYRDVGSSGLRQYGGWVREEFLRALQGREAQRVFREMGDNSAVIGSVLFSITQAMRKVDWREEAANDTPQALEAANFARSLRFDMSHPWEDHVVEALSMLQYGFAPCEIVYKRRLGHRGSALQRSDASSNHSDGRIGVRRLPLRGQETILKWFFDSNGQVTGLTQQPWLGSLIDLPIEKLLLYRPTMHKDNPEGRSILRTAYRPWYLLKRIEELEAVLFERMGGLPVMLVPNALLEAAKANDAGALAALNAYKDLVKNVRADEQMGLVLPSDPYRDANGSPTAHRMYDFELKTPNTSALRVDSDKVIHRYSVDILKSCLADFIDLGHQARGTQNLAISKVDMFYTAIEGWLKSISSVQNRYLLPRVWELNGLSYDLLPQYVPDLPMRVDLDVLGKFILALAQSGMRMFPDRELENYIRGAAGMPDITEEEQYEPSIDESIENRLYEAGDRPTAAGADDVAKHVLGLAALAHRRDQKRPYALAGVEKLTTHELDRAAAAADPNPTPGRREAGNYPKGHVNFHGLRFSIENPKGSIRTGTNAATGETWRSVLPVHYGYVRRTNPGADGEAIDVYFGPNPGATTVWVIDQLNPDTGEFDEHKACVGFDSMSSALLAYQQAFSDGRGADRIGAVHRVSIDGFKSWARGDSTGLPLGGVVGKRARRFDGMDVKLNGGIGVKLNGSSSLANGAHR